MAGRGYIEGKTNILPAKEVELAQDKVDVYAQPAAQSALKAQFSRGAIFYILDKADDGWIRVRDLLGNEGLSLEMSK